jgi:hypothetical protein
MDEARSRENRVPSWPTTSAWYLSEHQQLPGCEPIGIGEALNPLMDYTSTHKWSIGNDGAGKPPAQQVRRIISMVAVSYRRPPVGYADQMDQDLHVYASAFFVDVFSCHKRCVVQLTDDSQPFAKPGSHFLPTSAQLHHLSSSRLPPSHPSRIWLGAYGKPDRNPNAYS